MALQDRGIYKIAYPSYLLAPPYPPRHSKCYKEDYEMFSDLKTKGRLVPTNLRKFLCDKEADIENLPTSCSAGSLAYVIESGKKYILNNEKDWVEKVCAAGSGSGSGSGSGTGDLPEELTDPEIDAIFN